MSSKIVIAKPCHENWNKMTTEEQGRHCAVCSKVVKDFTKMKTEEIIHTLKTTDGEVCGRVNVKELTPANKKQKVYFLINGVLFRKLVYPVMALLGVSLISKKAVAQIGHDYPVKGKMAVNNYHTNDKKITVVVKTSQGNLPLSNASVTFVSGIKNHPETLTTDEKGRVMINVKAEDLIGDEIQIEISAAGYEYKLSTAKIIKDNQTIEIRMEDEVIMMGEMMYIPDNNEPDQTNKILPDSTTFTKSETNEPIQITHCGFQEIKDIQLLDGTDLYRTVCTFGQENYLDEPIAISLIENIKEPELIQPENNLTNEIISDRFIVFPVPSYDYVNIVSEKNENFNIDIFDGNGKKIHSIINSNGRYTLDVSNYSAGIYYVLISKEGKAIETKKIIVNR